MQVGDLVKHTGLNDVTWIGIVTNLGTPQGSDSKAFVVWATGGHGWQYCSGLEVVCK